MNVGIPRHARSRVRQRVLRECVAILAGTVFFIALAATVGIPDRDPQPVSAHVESVVSPLPGSALYGYRRAEPEMSADFR